MKIQALLAAAALAVATPALAYDTDDYGFPIEPAALSSYRGASATYRSTPRFFRPIRQALPLFSRATPVTTIAPVVVRTRVVAPTTAKTQRLVVGARSSTTLQR